MQRRQQEHAEVNVPNAVEHVKHALQSDRAWMTHQRIAAVETGKGKGPRNALAVLHLLHGESAAAAVADESARVAEASRVALRNEDDRERGLQRGNGTEEGTSGRPAPSVDSISRLARVVVRMLDSKKYAPTWSSIGVNVKRIFDLERRAPDAPSLRMVALVQKLDCEVQRRDVAGARTTVAILYRKIENADLEDALSFAGRQVVPSHATGSLDGISGRADPLDVLRQQMTMAGLTSSLVRLLFADFSECADGPAATLSLYNEALILVRDIQFQAPSPSGSQCHLYESLLCSASKPRPGLLRRLTELMLLGNTSSELFYTGSMLLEDVMASCDTVLSARDEIGVDLLSRALDTLTGKRLAIFCRAIALMLIEPEVNSCQNADIVDELVVEAALEIR